MSEGSWWSCCGRSLSTTEVCPNCWRVFEAVANTKHYQGFGSSRGYADGTANHANAEPCVDRGVQPALKLSGLTKQEIAKAIRGLADEINEASHKPHEWELVQRIAVAIGELASIAAWHDAANLDGEQAT